MSTLTRTTREDQPLLEHHHQHLPLPNPPPQTGRPFRWGAASLLYFVGFGGLGYKSVTSFVAKAMVTGGFFGAGSVLCGAACLYCGYRVYDALRNRNIQPIVPAQDVAAARANVEILRLVNNRLNGLLSDSIVIDLEGGPSDVQLHESIHKQLSELEHMLPLMRTEIAELQGAIQAVIASKSLRSPSVGSLDSPNGAGGDSSFEQALLGRIDALSKKVSRDQSSRNASRLSSTTNSPAVGGSASSFAAVSPYAPSPAGRQSPPAKRLTFAGVDGGTPLTPIVENAKK